MVKNLPANAGDVRDAGSILGWERFSGGGRGNPLQYSCLENLMDRGAWQPTVQGVAKSDMTEQLSVSMIDVITIHAKEKVQKHPVYFLLIIGMLYLKRYMSNR